MLDDKSENQPLDKDILECKADLRRVLGAIDKTSSNLPTIEEAINNQTPAKTAGPVKEEDEIFLESELAGSDSPSGDIPLSNLAPKDKPSKSTPIRILSFDALQKNTISETTSPHVNVNESANNKTTNQRHANPSTAALKETELRPVQEDHLQEIEKKLQKKNTLLEQQEQRLSFVEKNLQNAIVLEREKFELRHDVEDLSSKNKQLSEEKQQLDQNNQHLISEIAELRSQLNNFNATNSQIEKLQKELENVQSAFSHEKARTQELAGTIKTLESNLAKSQQDNLEKSEEFSAKSNELQQLTSKYNQLRDEHEHLRNQKDQNLEKLTVRLKDSEANLNQLETDLKQAHHEYEAMQTQTRGEIGILTEKTNSLQRENHSLTAEISRFKDELEDSRATSAHVQQLRKELESVELTLSHERAEMRNLEGTLKTLGDELEEINQDKQHLSEKLTAKEQELEQQQQKLEQLQSEYERFRYQEDSELVSLNAQLRSSKSDLQQLTTELEQARHEYEALQTQTHGEIGALTEKTGFLQNENQTLSEEISRLKKDLENAKETSEKLQNIEINFKNAHEELLDERKHSEDIRQKYEQVKATLSKAQEEKEALLNQQQELEHQIKDIQEAPFSPAPEETFNLSEEPPLESIDNPQKEVDDIPAFNLAEQIIEEQRRSAANRRQRVKPVSNASRGTSTMSVVQQYVHPAESATVSVNRKTEIDQSQWIDQSLTPFQQEILEEIVRKDMEFYSHKHLSSVKYHSMNN